MYQKIAKKMCDEIQKSFPLSPKVVTALCAVDREMFVPSVFAHQAYEINALPMVDSQWISSPLTVAQMSEYLAPNGGDSVLLLINLKRVECLSHLCLKMESKSLNVLKNIMAYLRVAKSYQNAFL